MKTYLKILLIVLPYFAIAEEQPGQIWSRGFSQIIWDVTFSPDSRYVVANESGKLYIITTETNEVVQLLGGKCAFFTSDNQFFWFVNGTDLIKTRVDEWIGLDTIELSMEPDPSRKTNSLNYTYNGQYAILSKGFINNFNRDPLGIDIYNLETKQLEKHIETSHPANFASMSYDNRYLAFSWDWEVKNTQPNENGRREWGYKCIIYNYLENLPIVSVSDKMYLPRYSPIDNYFLYNCKDIYSIYLVNLIDDFPNKTFSLQINSSTTPWTRDGNNFVTLSDVGINIYSTETWEKVLEFPNPLEFMDVIVNEDLSKAILFDAGVKQTNIRLIDLTGTSVGLETDFNLTINPNPVLNQSNISFNLDIPSQIKLSVIDIIGNQIQIINNDFYQSGENQIPFNTQGLTTGVYFIKLEVNGKFQTKQIVK